MQLKLTWNSLCCPGWHKLLHFSPLSLQCLDYRYIPKHKALENAEPFSKMSLVVCTSSEQGPLGKFGVSPHHIDSFFAIGTGLSSGEWHGLVDILFPCRVLSDSPRASDSPLCVWTVWGRSVCRVLKEIRGTLASAQPWIDSVLCG